MINQAGSLLNRSRILPPWPPAILQARRPRVLSPETLEGVDKAIVEREIPRRYAGASANHAGALMAEHLDRMPYWRANALSRGGNEDGV